MRYYLLPIFLLVLLAACGRNDGPVYPKEFIGNWVGVEKTDIGYHFVNDSLFLVYDENDTNRCKVMELHDSILIIKGLLWNEEKEVSFMRQKR